MAISDMPLVLLEACAPQISPITLAAIVQQESHGDWLAIHDNTARTTSHPETVDQAVDLAQGLMAEGHSVDLGLAQINSSNLARLGLPVRSAFEPCTNLHAAQVVLLQAWRGSGGDLSVTLALYHTGCSHHCSAAQQLAGTTYSASVYCQAGVVVPAIPGGHLPSWVLQPAVAAPSLTIAVSASPQASSLMPRVGNLSIARRATQ